MLNISPNSIKSEIKSDDYISLGQVDLANSRVLWLRWVSIALLLFLGVLFLPWTQNVQGKGKVTTLRPEHRPQTIHATIAGRIEQWYVQEGQLVKAGDTIVRLSEIKTDYFDPDLLDRTRQQVVAKEGAIESYKEKAQALENQIAALEKGLTLKERQLRNKVIQSRLKITSDSIDFIRAELDEKIARNQLSRSEELYKQGIVPLSDLEQKKLKVQETSAKTIAAANYLGVSQNELANAQLELQSILYEYRDKIAKANSERFSALSAMYDSEGAVNKMQIQASNYAQRAGFYYITCPQNAYITKALKKGIGEIIKESDALVSIMPSDYELAVEMYVEPVDLPLIKMGEQARFIFDGWPAFVFSGWPNMSFGTYGGRIVGIDNVTSDNGKYRILVARTTKEQPWPEPLRPGSAAQGLILMNNVPVWYELWRKLNGFPPDYYEQPGEENPAEDKPKTKAPIKSIK